MDTELHDVLAQYPAWVRGRAESLGAHGGFSGAKLWRIVAASGLYGLKAWPTPGPTCEELTGIHQWMARVPFPWMPRVLAAETGATAVSRHGRVWELTTWQPGRADFVQNPSRARLESACVAAAQLHQVWRPSPPTLAICPAVLRRLERWRSWQQLRDSGWAPEIPAGGPFLPAAARLWRHVERTIGELPAILTPWLARLLPIQPCVCDLWHDHILYTGDAVTGIVDFGSVKFDHVAVDLARLLGSLVGDDTLMWDSGLQAYESVRPLREMEIALARDLDRTGTIIAATNWLRRLYLEQRRYVDTHAVRGRLEHLASRLEKLP